MTGSEHFEILLPAATFKVDIHLGAPALPAPLEYGLLVAIRAGHNTVQALAPALSIGYRPVIDLILRCWRKRYLNLRLRDNRLALSPLGQSFIPDDTPDGRDTVPLSLSEPQRMTINMVCELLSGQILAFPPQTGGNGRYQSAPALVEQDRYRSASDTELLSALKRKPDIARQLKQVSAYGISISPDHEQRDRTQLTHIKTKLAVKRTPDDRIQIAVVDDTYYFGRAAREIEQTLSQFVQSEGEEHPFAKLLKTKAQHAEGGTTRTLEQDFEAFYDLIAKFRKSDVSTLTQRYTELYQKLDYLLDAVINEERHQADVSIIRSCKTAMDRCQQLFQTPYHQLALSVPEFDVGRLSHIDSEISNAIERNRQSGDNFDYADGRVHYLWGHSGEIELEFQKRKTLTDIGDSEFMEITPDLPSAIDVPFLIRDDQEVILPLFNLFEDRGNADSLSLRVKSKKGSNRAIQQLLEWTKLKVPEYKQRKLFATNFKEGSVSSDLVWSPPKSIDLAAEARKGTSKAKLALDSWLNHWEEQARSLQRACIAMDERVAVHYNEDILNKVLDLLGSEGPLFFGVSGFNDRTITAPLRAALRKRNQKPTYIVCRPVVGYPEERLRELFSSAFESDVTPFIQIDKSWSGLVLCTEAEILVCASPKWLPGRDDLGRRAKIHSFGLSVRGSRCAGQFWKTIIHDRYSFPDHGLKRSPAATFDYHAENENNRFRELALQLQLKGGDRDALYQIFQEVWSNQKDIGPDLRRLKSQIPAQTYAELVAMALSSRQLTPKDRSRYFMDLCWQRWQEKKYFESLVFAGAAESESVPPDWLHQLVITRSPPHDITGFLEAAAPDAREASLWILLDIMCFDGATDAVLTQIAWLSSTMTETLVRNFSDELIGYWTATHSAMPRNGKVESRPTTEEALVAFKEVMSQMHMPGGPMTFDNTTCNEVTKRLIGSNGLVTELEAEFDRFLSAPVRTQSNKVYDKIKTAAQDWLATNSRSEQKILKKAEDMGKVQGKATKIIGFRRETMNRNISKIVSVIVDIAKSSSQQQVGNQILMDARNKLLAEYKQRHRPHLNEKYMAENRANSLVRPILDELLNALDKQEAGS